jgi:peptide/nickel transport system ATP-binding protein
MNASTTSRTDTTTPILEVEGLNVDFFVNGDWVTAAADINFVVRPGEVLAIVGESGSGKSVSSMSLLGLLPKNARTSGSAKLNGSRPCAALAARTSP